MATRKTRAAAPRPAPMDGVGIYALPSHQQRSALSVLRIVGAAERVICAKGIDGFSMSAVAAEAELSVGGLYRRFANKEKLLSTINDLALKRARERFEAAVTRAPLMSAEAVLGATARGLCASLGEEEVLHRRLYEAGLKEPALFRRGLESRFRSSHAFYIMLLPHLQHLEPSSARTVILMVWEVMMGAVLNKLSTESEALREMPWDAFRDELTAMVTAYLRMQTPSAPG